MIFTAYLVSCDMVRILACLYPGLHPSRGVACYLYERGLIGGGVFVFTAGDPEMIPQVVDFMHR